MDERKLEALFQDAARAAPPASFDEQDVARASRRVTARRRVAGTCRSPASKVCRVATESSTPPEAAGVSGSSSLACSRRHGRRDSSITARVNVLRT